MADYDPKIIPTLDDIIEDELDEEIKETVIDLSSLLAHNDDDENEDDNFDLFAAELEPDTEDGTTAGPAIETDIETGSVADLDTDIEDSSPQIGAIEDIEAPDALIIDSELSSTTDIEAVADIDLTVSDEIDNSIDIDSNNGIPQIDLDTSGLDAFEAPDIEITDAELSSIETEDESTLLDEGAPEEGQIESALIDYHTEEDNDIIIDTHHLHHEETQAEPSPEALHETQAEPQIEISAETGLEMEVAETADSDLTSETQVEKFAENVPEIPLDDITATEPGDDLNNDTLTEHNLVDESQDEVVPESAIISPDDEYEEDAGIAPEAEDVLSTISLEDLSDNIIQQLMPELEQQLRFLVLKALHEKLPAEITRQLSPNSMRKDGDDNSSD